MMKKNNYTGLTTHSLPPSKDRKGPRDLDSPRYRHHTSTRVPEIGDKFKLDIAYIVQDTKAGKKCTAMTKIRFIDNKWELVPRNQPGMYVFFDKDPTDRHKHFVITSIIPNKTAAYARLE